MVNLHQELSMAEHTATEPQSRRQRLQFVVGHIVSEPVCTIIYVDIQVSSVYLLNPALVCAWMQKHWHCWQPAHTVVKSCCAKLRLLNRPGTILAVCPSLGFANVLANKCSCRWSLQRPGTKPVALIRTPLIAFSHWLILCCFKSSAVIYSCRLSGENGLYFVVIEKRWVFLWW